ncbi:hypothetical protein QUB70_23125 [Microcoleus sp. A003_D6]
MGRFLNYTIEEGRRKKEEGRRKKEEGKCSHGKGFTVQKCLNRLGGCDIY